MTTKKSSSTSLVMFEALGGIFGWIWILSIPTSIVLVVLALFFSWSWMYVGYSVVAGLLAKWLLRGFRDNHERCRLEQWLVNTHGYSKEDAYKIWLIAYGNGGGDGHSRVLSMHGLPKETLDKLLI